MTEVRRYTVLGRAERYSEEIANRKYGPPSEPKRTFEQARKTLLPQVKDVVRAVAKIPDAQRLDEVVVEVRLGEDYLAKSYHPEDLLRTVGLNLRGSGVWEPPAKPRPAPKEGAKPKPPAPPVRAKSLFVSGDQKALGAMQQLLESGAGNKEAIKDVIALEQVRLPTAGERLAAGLLEDERALIAIEIVLFAWDSRQRDKAVARLKELLARYKVDPDALLVRPYVNGPTFVAGKVPHAALASLSHLNFLRVARLLPRVELTRRAIGLPTPAPAPPKIVAEPKHWIAIFDGGVTLPHPHLDGLVVAKDCTTKAPLKSYVEHGTAVCSAALYDSISPNSKLEQPVCGVMSFRVLPDARDDDLELYGAVDAIEKEVPLLPPTAQIVSLSFGPAGPIETSAAPGRFTYALDRLSYETGRLFFTAVGNWGQRVGLERIQGPSDSVNNIAVGAYRLEPTSGERVPAEYSCKGPGRSGGAIKPDIVAFGGSPHAPFHVLDATAGSIVGTQGTSFATPSASAMGGALIARVASPITGQVCRALLLSAAEYLEGHDEDAFGWGALPSSLDTVLACTRTRVAVAYAGIVNPRRSWRLPFLLPDAFSPNGNTLFQWTIVFTPDVDPTAVDDYTLAGIEHGFRPHKNKFRFTHRDHPKKPLVFDLVKDAAVIVAREAEGWKRGAQPVSDQNVRRKETLLRAREAKWETVVCGRRSKQQDALLDPALTIGILGRGSWDKLAPDLQARYAAVLTVTAPKYKGDLYADMLRASPLLQPIMLRSRLEVLTSARSSTGLGEGTGSSEA
ncbi:MAG: S8 family peptidase [Polyangiaceae bacterium]